jgi:predicted transcriptional regulator
MADDNQTDLTALTVQLVSAFVSNNTVASDSLADLIKTTRAALTVVPTPAVEEPAAPIFAPAVSVRKSLSSPEHIISLIDGKPYKTLKRHLAANNLTPEQYRERYKLPKTYPLVAPSYSDSRRAVAEKIGLGKKPVVAAKPVEAAPALAVASAAVAAATTKAPKKAAPAPAKKSAKANVSPATSAAHPAAEALEVAAKPTMATGKKAVKTRNAQPKATPMIASGAITAGAAPAAVKKEARKRLSIAAPKAEKVDAKAKAAPASKPARSATKKAEPASKATEPAPVKA